MIKSPKNYSLSPNLKDLVKSLGGLIVGLFNSELRDHAVTIIKRFFVYSYQRFKFGFDESEAWDLQTTIIRFIILG